MKIFIYALVDPTSGCTRYIGRTKNIKKRYKDHLRNLKFCTHKTNWIKNLKSQGLKPFIFIIEECDEVSAIVRETYWIEFLKSQKVNLVNSTDGGDGLLNPSENVRDKIRQKMIGRPVSEETRRRRSIAMKGRMFSPEHRKKLSDALIGRKLSETHKNNLSRNWTQERREQLRARNKTEMQRFSVLASWTEERRQELSKRMRLLNQKN